MKTKLLQFIHLSLGVALLSFTPGCGSPSPRETSIDLAEGVRLEMIRLLTGIWIGKYEVTQAQWEAVMGNNPSGFNGPDNPVAFVSWNDCQEFLEELNSLPSVRESGLTFRLPTEEEWEFARRAGAKGKYCRLANGTEITENTLGKVAWFEGNADKQPHSVGQKKSSAFGLYDMIGNVSEWTSTWTSIGNGEDENRVICGGGWKTSAKDCESSYKPGYYSRGHSPTIRFYDIGFRLCASGGVN